MNQPPRQIVGEILDTCYAVVKLFLDSRIKNIQFKTQHEMDLELNNVKKDLLGALTFFIVNYDQIMGIRILEIYPATDQKEAKFMRTLLFELKHYRNQWAHSKDFTTRELQRICGTVLLVFEEMHLDMNSDYYRKIQTGHDQLLVQMSQIIEKERVYKEYQAQQTQQQQIQQILAGQNQHTFLIQYANNKMQPFQ